MQDDLIPSESSEQSSGTESGAVKTFEELLTSSQISRALSNQGICCPTSLQAKALPLFQQGSNLMLHGDLGRGKSLTCAIGIGLRREDAPGAFKAIVVTPSNQCIESMSATLKSFGINTVTVSGENRINMKNADVFIGLPLNILNSLEAKSLDLSRVSCVVLEDADEALSIHPYEEVESILNLTRQAQHSIQLVCVGKSSSGGVEDLAAKYFSDGVIVEDDASEKHSSAKAAEANADGTTDAVVESTPVEVDHCYFEVNGDLLAKPNLLAAIIEAGEMPATVVFCNSPSDCDFVEVMLKKRGIPARKLIGHVPTSKVERAQEQVAAGTVTALVVTDIGARDLHFDQVDLIVQYSVHTDPDVYMQRIGPSQKAGRLHKVISLVSPLDRGNFHYLQKVTNYEFKEDKPPSEDDLQDLRLKRLIVVAEKNHHARNETFTKLAESLLQKETPQRLIAYLLYNTLELLPGLLANTQEEDMEDGDKSEDRHERGSSRRDRDSRRGRGGRDSDRSRRGEGRRGRRDDYDGESRGSRQSREPLNNTDHVEATVRLPPQRDARIYLGHGKNSEFSESEFMKLVTDKCDVTPDLVKRFTLREKYAFVDFPEEVAESVLRDLTGATLNNGDELFARRATVISVPRDEIAEGETAGDSATSEADAVQKVSGHESNDEASSPDTPSEVENEAQTAENGE